MTLAIKSLSLFELICDYPYIYNKVGKLELRTGKFIFPSLRRSCIYTWSKINLNFAE